MNNETELLEEGSKEGENGVFVREDAMFLICDDFTVLQSLTQLSTQCPFSSELPHNTSRGYCEPYEHGKLYLGSIDNLYESVKDLDPSWFIKPSDKSLLNPKVASQFGCKRNPLNVLQEDALLSIGLAFQRNRPCLFVVTGDLKVIPMTTDSSFPYLQELENFKLDDVEQHTVKIRKRSHEALNLMRASLTCKEAALTQSLFYLLRKWKCQRWIPFWGVLPRKNKKHGKKKEEKEKASGKTSNMRNRDKS
ncbi:hypothetical protein Fmac_010514 [Flemingia macrophylla]|uniref:Uncharacterized protein n=1 Tax=Flemingia macrophylla TaxID=520843 RepID=A0ABD1MJU9_9FABA